MSSHSSPDRRCSGEESVADSRRRTGTRRCIGSVAKPPLQRQRLLSGRGLGGGASGPRQRSLSGMQALLCTGDGIGLPIAAIGPSQSTQCMSVDSCHLSKRSQGPPDGRDDKLKFCPMPVRPWSTQQARGWGPLNSMQFRSPRWHQLATEQPRRRRLPDDRMPAPVAPRSTFSEPLFAMGGIPGSRLCHIGTKRAWGVIHSKPRGGWHVLCSEGDVAAAANAATEKALGGNKGGLTRGNLFFWDPNFFPHKPPSHRLPVQPDRA